MKLLRERAQMAKGVRHFFDVRGFLEVQTPVIVPSPGLDLHLNAFELAQAEGGAARWLSTSPEYQMKRLLADGWSNIYQFAPCFRRGESGTQHNSEFTMLEWYRARAGVEEMIADTERLLADVTEGRVRLGDRTIEIEPPFDRLPLCQAFARYAGWSIEETLDAAAHEEDRFFRTFVERIDPALESFEKPVWLVDYPASQASLARLKPNDRRFAERFELYVGGVELCNGFGELVDPVEQRSRLAQQQAERRARGLPVYPIDERFLEALGRVPPSGGNALGFDRLVALANGTLDVKRAIAFAEEEL